MLVGAALLALGMLADAGAAAGRCLFDVQLKQFALNNGFHRNITYGVVFHGEGSDWRLYQHCIVGVEQSLPPGLFVNPDELRDLRRVARLNAFPRSKVNVELPAEHASSSIVYIIGKITDGQVNMWVPVHARYHKAQTGGGTARNVVPAPKLFLRCPDQRLDVCNMPTPPDLIFLCNGSSKQKCEWKEISYNMLSDVIRWDVPVGNTDHFFTVAAGTCLVVLLGSLYLLRSIHRYNVQAMKKSA